LEAKNCDQTELRRHLFLRIGAGFFASYWRDGSAGEQSCSGQHSWAESSY